MRIDRLISLHRSPYSASKPVQGYSYLFEIFALLWLKICNRLSTNWVAANFIFFHFSNFQHCFNGILHWIWSLVCSFCHFPAERSQNLIKRFRWIKAAKNSINNKFRGHIDDVSEFLRCDRSKCLGSSRTWIDCRSVFSPLFFASLFVFSGSFAHIHIIIVEFDYGEI